MVSVEPSGTEPPTKLALEHWAEMNKLLVKPGHGSPNMLPPHD